MVEVTLENKVSDKYIIGVTGEIGAGKSYVSEKFVEYGKRYGINVNNIELDYIGHQILESKELRYESVRKTIIKTFGKNVSLSDEYVNRKVLGEIVFNNHKKLEELNKIMYQPLITKTKREVYEKNGLVLLNGALLIEFDMTSLCNNNVVLIEVDKKSQINRLMKKNLTKEQIQKRLESQYTFEQKKRRLIEIIDRDKQGKVWEIHNSDNKDESEISQVFEEILKYYSIKTPY